MIGINLSFFQAYGLELTFSVNDDSWRYKLLIRKATNPTEIDQAYKMQTLTETDVINASIKCKI
jgi:hypothetical protein